MQFVHYLFLLQIHVTSFPIPPPALSKNVPSPPTTSLFLPTSLRSLPTFLFVLHPPILCHPTFSSTSSATSRHLHLLPNRSTSYPPSHTPLLLLLILVQFCQ